MKTLTSELKNATADNGLNGWKYWAHISYLLLNESLYKCLCKQPLQNKNNYKHKRWEVQKRWWSM